MLEKVLVRRITGAAGRTPPREKNPGTNELVLNQGTSQCFVLFCFALLCFALLCPGTFREEGGFVFLLGLAKWKVDL